MTTDASQDRADSTAYAREFLRAVKETEDARWYSEPGREFLYRPGQMLVAVEEAARVIRKIGERGDSGEIQPVGGKLALLHVARDADVPAWVSFLRNPETWPGEPVPAVQPHHLVVGYGNVMGHPDEPPVPAGEQRGPDPRRADAGRGVTVGICDTGIWKDAPAVHPGWLGGQFEPQVDDVDGLVQAGTPLLDLQAGHGTFVAGVLRVTAPGVRFDPEVALQPNGLGDELGVLQALSALEPGVEIVNLSLGCVTQDNAPSLPLARGLEQLGRDVVVVAAAGNSGTDRPRWPAAFKRVIAVAAVEDVDGRLVPAPYTSFGPWVDACAPGRHLSSYVVGDMTVGGAVRSFDRYAQWDGTSFAAPYVAGRIAELMTRLAVPAREAARRLLDHPRWHPDLGVLVL